jgi:hypothetical protein
MFVHPRPAKLRDIVNVASRQGVFAEGSFDNVCETIDSTTSTLEILVGAYQPEGGLVHEYVI